MGYEDFVDIVLESSQTGLVTVLGVISMHLGSFFKVYEQNMDTFWVGKISKIFFEVCLIFPIFF